MAVVEIVVPTHRLLICECGWTTLDRPYNGWTLSEITSSHAEHCALFETLTQYCTGFSGLRNRVVLVRYAGRARVLFSLPDGP